jgi:hypothetical protein
MFQMTILEFILPVVAEPKAALLARVAVGQLFARWRSLKNENGPPLGPAFFADCHKPHITGWVFNWAWDSACSPNGHFFGTS